MADQKIKYKHVYTEYNLNELTLQTPVIAKLAKKHKLQNGECIVFTNRTYKRFRILEKRNGAFWIRAGQIDKTDERGMYLILLDSIEREVADSTSEKILLSISEIRIVGEYFQNKVVKRRRK